MMKIVREMYFFSSLSFLFLLFSSKMLSLMDWKICGNSRLINFYHSTNSLYDFRITWRVYREGFGTGREHRETEGEREGGGVEAAAFPDYSTRNFVFNIRNNWTSAISLFLISPSLFQFFLHVSICIYSHARIKL